MGGGTIFDRLAASGRRTAARQTARAERRAAIERAVRVPALVGAAVLALVAWWLSGWQMWPWTGAVVALAVLALLGVRQRLGVASTATVALLVTDVWLLAYVDPWWWALLVGLAVTGAGVVAAVRLRFRVRRRETISALAAGGALLVASVIGLVVDAAQRAEDAQRVLDQGHEEAVARILPRTPASMVAFLVERIAWPDRPYAVTNVCWMFTPEAQRQLADAHHVPDCQAAIRALAGQVTDPADYVNNLWLPGQASQPGPGGTLLVDACHLDFSRLTDDTPNASPGPQIGHLTLTQQLGEGHRITAYRPC